MSYPPSEDVIRKVFNSLYAHPFKSLAPDVWPGDLTLDSAVAETARRLGLTEERVSDAVHGWPKDWRESTERAFSRKQRG